MRGREEDLTELDDIWMAEPAQATAPQTAPKPWALLLSQTACLTHTALHGT